MVSWVLDLFLCYNRPCRDYNCNLASLGFLLGIMGLLKKRIGVSVLIIVCSVQSVVGKTSQIDSLVTELVMLKGERDVVFHKRISQVVKPSEERFIPFLNNVIKETYQENEWLGGIVLQYKSSLLFKQGRILESLAAIDSSFDLFSDLDDSVHIARYHLIKGDVFSSLKNIDKSYYHLRTAIHIYKTVSDSSSLALSYLNIGNTFFYDEKYDSAYYYYERISQYYKNENSLLGYYQRMNIGNWHLHFKNYEKALLYLLPIEDGLKKLNYNYGLSFLYSNMAEAYQGLGQFDSALFYHRKAVYVCKVQKLGIHFINVSKAIASTFKKIGQLDSALFYSELQMELNDSLLNMRINQEITQKESENQLLIHQKDIELKNEELKTSSIVKWSMGVISFLLLTGLVTTYRNSKKEKEANKALIKTNKELAATQEALKKAWISNLEKDVAVNLVRKEVKKEPEAMNQESTEKEEKIRQLIRQLEVEIHQGVYRKNDLTLESLSKILKTNRTYLSESINTYYGKNFNSFLNEHRIIEARQILVNNNRNYTIEAISQMVGFKSISVFNTAFKKHTGLTPSYFEKKSRQQEN